MGDETRRRRFDILGVLFITDQRCMSTVKVYRDTQCDSNIDLLAWVQLLFLDSSRAREKQTGWAVKE